MQLFDPQSAVYHKKGEETVLFQQLQYSLHAEQWSHEESGKQLLESF